MKQCSSTWMPLHDSPRISHLLLEELIGPATMIGRVGLGHYLALLICVGRRFAPAVVLIFAVANASALAKDRGAMSKSVDDEDASTTAGHRGRWGRCTSAVSQLTIETSGEQRYDDDTEVAQIKLRTAQGKRYTTDLGGNVGCLAYSESTHKYVLGAIGQIGAWLPLREIWYLDEITGALDQSKALPAWSENRGSWCAFAAVANQDGRFVVFVSDYDSERALDVLDTKEDRLIRIGEPPLPLPSSWARENVTRRIDFAWGMAEAASDRFIRIDPGILVWHGHVLEASYGKDRPSKRAKPRTTKRWDMDALARPGSHCPSPTCHPGP